MDFPWLEPSDRAAAVAATLTLVGRAAIRGPVPAFAVRATAPASGKGLLADAITIVGTGRVAARMTTAGRDPDELRKRILAVALEGLPVVLIDDIQHPLGSEHLAAALTAEVWQDRLLGISGTVAAPLRAVWLFTGNGLVFRGDLGRRVIPIDLEARVEFPEDRSGFQHVDLKAYVRERRPELVRAALTVLRAYHIAGRLPPWSPSPDRLVRGMG